MIIETWVFVLIFLVISILALICAGGWIIEGERHSKEEKELRYEIKKLSTQLAHRIAIDNIKAANDYYNNKEN